MEMLVYIIYMLGVSPLIGCLTVYMMIRFSNHAVKIFLVGIILVTIGLLVGMGVTLELTGWQPPRGA